MGLVYEQTRQNEVMTKLFLKPSFIEGKSKKLKECRKYTFTWYVVVLEIPWFDFEVIQGGPIP